MENIGTAFQLMSVGMGTVFVILLIVIWLGKFLINLVNRYAPEEVVVKKNATAPAAKVAPVDALTAEIIGEAVKVLTGGKGRVGSIVKK